MREVSPIAQSITDEKSNALLEVGLKVIKIILEFRVVDHRKQSFTVFPKETALKLFKNSASNCKLSTLGKKR